MNLKGSLSLAGIIAINSLQLNAQSFAETALRFGRTYPGGSARMQSLGGAQTSLGADYSSALSNPAGLGMYNRSEFILSPALNIAPSAAVYLGKKTKETQTTLYIPGIAASFHNDYDRLNGFLGGTFSIAFNRINDFNRIIKYEGTNPNNSIIDYFIENSNGATIQQFNASGDLYNTPTELAFNNYLIGDSAILNPSYSPMAYFTDVPGIPFQAEEIRTQGAQNQWSFSYGVNYNDRLFLGLGIGITSINYKSTKVYTENFVNGPLFDLRLEETLEIRGNGVNGTFGAIYRPIDILQLGISATTPTHYELTDTYSATMNSNWDNFQYNPGTLLNAEQAATDAVTSRYTFKVPWKLSAGATIFLKKNGFFSIDAERINYASAKYKSITEGVLLNSDNEEIKSLYKAVYNIRAGAEYRYNLFRFRTGFAFMPEPFTSEQNGVSRKLIKFSGGVGYRTSSFYIDLALIYSSGKTSYRPYTVNTADSPLVTNELKNTNVVFTLGFPF